MEKIHRSKFATHFITFLFILAIAIIVIGIFAIGDMAKKDNTFMVVSFSFAVVVFLAFLALGCFVFNRLGAIIYYDSENRVLIRKGCICGFESRINVDDIKSVEKVTFPREDTFYILIDDKHSKRDGLYTDSYFSITCSKESKEFIEKFWDGELESFIY